MARFVLLICIVMSLGTVGFAQSVTTFWGGAYPQTQECGPAVAAMGGAGAALPGELGAALLNPATLGGSSAPKGWSLMLDATYAESFFPQDAIVARRWYVGKTGKVVLDLVYGKDSSERRMYPGFAVVSYNSGRWAVGLIANRSVNYAMPYAQGAISATWWRPVWSTSFGHSPEWGAGNLHEEEVALLAAFQVGRHISLGVGAIYADTSVSVTSTIHDIDFPKVSVGKVGNWSSSRRLVPLLGILWRDGQWSLGLSYEGGFSTVMNEESVFYQYLSQYQGEYRRPPRASFGLAFSSDHVQLSVQADYLWSELQSNQVSPFYPAAWFRTDNGHAYRAGLRFTGFKGLGRTQFMVGISYVRNNGLYYLPGATATSPMGKDRLYHSYLDYSMSLLYPIHRPLTTVSCGASIDLGKSVFLIPEIQASSYSKVARLGLSMTF